MKIFESFLEKLNEEFLGYMQDRSNKTVGVYKNPKSIKRMDPGIRAVAYKNGDLFVADSSYDLIHMDIVQYLEYNTKEPIFFDRFAHKEHQVHLMRYKDTNFFYLGDYSFQDIKFKYSFFYKNIEKM